MQELGGFQEVEARGSGLSGIRFRMISLLHRNVQRFRGGLVFKAHRRLYHSLLGLRVIKKKDLATNSTFCAMPGLDVCHVRVDALFEAW